LLGGLNAYLAVSDPYTRVDRFGLTQGGGDDGCGPNNGTSAPEPPKVPDEADSGGKARRVQPGGAATDMPLERRGTARETATDLDAQAKRAQAAGFPHGVSVTSRGRNESMGIPPEQVSAATREQFEKAGFPVHYTPGQGRKGDTTHHTVQLPNPVTPADADRFNATLGRT